MWRSLVARSAGGGEVISSNLVTPTKSPNFQTLCFQPVFKAQQGIETYLTDYFTNLIQYLYNPFTTNLPQIIGDLLVTKKTHDHQFLLILPLTYFTKKFDFKFR